MCCAVLCCCCAGIDICTGLCWYIDICTGFESNPIYYLPDIDFWGFEKKRGRRPAGGTYLFKYNLYIGGDNILTKKYFWSRLLYLLCFFTLATLITQKIHKYIYFWLFYIVHTNTHKTETKHNLKHTTNNSSHHITLTFLSFSLVSRYFIIN